MNKLLGVLLALCCLPVGAIAEERNEELQFGNFMVHGDLGCFAPVRGKMQTVYTPYHLKSTLPINTSEAVELDHQIFRMQGCDEATLGHIKLKAREHYGLVVRGKVTIQKSQGKSFMVQGICKTLFTETVTLDLGHGVKLLSRSEEERPMSDCAGS